MARNVDMLDDDFFSESSIEEEVDQPTSTHVGQSSRDESETTQVPVIQIDSGDDEEDEPPGSPPNDGRKKVQISRATVS